LALESVADAEAEFRERRGGLEEERALESQKVTGTDFPPCSAIHGLIPVVPCSFSGGVFCTYPSRLLGLFLCAAYLNFLGHIWIPMQYIPYVPT
jgi:hypothetical protein